jgi:2',3'-cyclic-nucleotide 2'-phosphodiesterase (5'-nucleotidase family)
VGAILRRPGGRIIIAAISSALRPERHALSQRSPKIPSASLPSGIDRRQALAGGAFSFAALFSGAAFAQGAAKITFLLTNDLYKISEEKGRGGMARLAAIVKAERAKGGAVLFVHAGDAFSPSLMSGFDQGEHMVALLNEMTLDVFTPGNHEFDFGKAAYLQRTSEAKFPIYAANLRDGAGQILPNHKDGEIQELAGLKVGVVGGCFEQAKQISSPGDLAFAPVVETMRDQATALRKKGADLVVAVVHGDKQQRARLWESGAVDVLLHGHNHDLYVNYDDKSVVAESGEDAHFVVAIDVTASVKVEGDKRTTSWSPNFRLIDTATATPDADMAARVKVYEEQLSKELDVEIGALLAPLDSRSATVRGQEAAIGNLIADAIKDRTGAEVALTNGGGIRAGKQYPVGAKLTRRDILQELPFGNKTAMTKVTGKALKAALENGLSQVENKAGRFPQVSGIKVIASLAAPAGQRVQSVEVNGAPLDEARVYTVATNDYMLRGGDGYTTLKAANATIDSGDSLIANDVMAYVRKLGQIDAKVEGRVVLK